MSPGLRLRAEDAEDLAILSAHVQDSVLRVGDLAFLPKQRRFAMLVNRFCWEGCPDGQKGERMRAGLHFDGVLRVQSQGISQDDPNQVLELLALNHVPGADGAGAVELLFAGGGRIRLDIECIDAQLRDLAGPWPATARPAHGLENT
jgi:hypothetical protein